MFWVCFRSLANLDNEKNRTLNFQDIDIEDENIIDVMDKYANYIRATLNNRKEEKLYSYSKCICIPLFKYSKNNEFPIIAIMNGKLNSVDISFSCNYYQWIKGYYTKDDDRNYITENYWGQELYKKSLKYEYKTNKLYAPENLSPISNLGNKCREKIIDWINREDILDCLVWK